MPASRALWVTVAALLACQEPPRAVPPAASAPGATEPAAVNAPPFAPSGEARGAEASSLASRTVPPSPLRLPRLGQEELQARFPSYPGALTPIVGMGERMVAHTLPMTLAYFEAKAGAREILEFYARHFRARGWAMVGTSDTREMVGRPALSATDPHDFTQMSVMVIGHGKGEPNTVILSIADMRPEARVVDTGDLPPYPGTTPLVVRSTEGGADAYSVSFMTPDGIAEVSSFFQMRMPALGYSEQLERGSPPSADRVSVAYVGAGRRWQIHLGRQSGGTVVTAIRSGAEEAP